MKKSVVKKCFGKNVCTDNVLKKYMFPWEFAKYKKFSSQSLPLTKDIAKIVAKANPPRPRQHIHPATKTFQALRIKINDELGEIETALPKAFNVLKQGGILAAISFHSLEDRIAKQFCKKMAGEKGNPLYKKFTMVYSVFEQRFE